MMISRKKKPENNVKSYFIKNPSGFLLTHIFASVNVCSRLSELSETDSTITPVSLFVWHPEKYDSKDKKYTITLAFSGSLAGAVHLGIPQKPLVKMAKKAKIIPEEFLKKLFESVGSSIQSVIEKYNDPVKISVHKDSIVNSAKKFDGNVLWVKYLISVPGFGEFLMEQAVSPSYLHSLAGHFLDDGNLEIPETETQLLDLLRKLNSAFQRQLISEITQAGTGQVDIGTGDIAESLNLEELRLAPDRAIRAILEEVPRRRISLKMQVLAISGMSEELRSRFMQNMSKNRRLEIRGGMQRILPDPEEVLSAQRDMAWLIIDMVEKHKLTLSKLLQSRLEKVVLSMDQAMAKSAMAYIKSSAFTDSMKALNPVVLQLSMRRVRRAVLIQALAFADQNTLQYYLENMTPVSSRLIQEDIDHWIKSISEESRRISAAASAQRAIIRAAVRLKKELKRGPF